MAANDWLGVLQQEYLRILSEKVGALSKLQSFLIKIPCKVANTTLDGMANTEAYVFVKVDARFTKVHMVERLFHKIAKQVDWDDLAYRFVLRLLEENGYQIPASRK